jgi:hypothetical protein
MKRGLVLTLWMAAASYAVEPADRFSADQVMAIAGKQITSKVYVDKGNMRQEMTVAGGPQMVSIVNAARGVVWMLMPGNMYMEHAIAQDDDVSRRAWTSAEHREPLGQETVGGVVCDAFRIKGAQELTFYADAKTGLPVAMKSADGKVSVEWRNAKAGEQPAELFQLPAGYQKLSLPNIPGLKLPGMK